MAKKKVYPDPDIVDRLSIALRMNGRNDTDWAKILRCERKAIWSWRNGVSSPQVTHLAVICDVTGISADWIIYGDRGDAPRLTAKDAEMMCEDYCRFPREWDDETEGMTMWDGPCSVCPMNKICEGGVANEENQGNSQAP